MRAGVLAAQGRRYAAAGGRGLCARLEGGVKLNDYSERELHEALELINATKELNTFDFHMKAVIHGLEVERKALQANLDTLTKRVAKAGFKKSDNS